MQLFYGQENVLLFENIFEIYSAVIVQSFVYKYLRFWVFFFTSRKKKKKGKLNYRRRKQDQRRSLRNGYIMLEINHALF